MPRLQFNSLDQMDQYTSVPDLFEARTTLFGGRKIVKTNETEAPFSLNLLVRTLQRFPAVDEEQQRTVNRIVDHIQTIDQQTETELQTKTLAHKPFRRLLTNIKRFFTKRFFKRDVILTALHREIAPKPKIEKSPSHSPIKSFSPQRTPSQKLNALDLYKGNLPVLSQVQKSNLFREIDKIVPVPNADPLSSVEGFLRAVSDGYEHPLNLAHPNCLRAIKDIYTYKAEEIKCACSEWLLGQPSFCPAVMTAIFDAYIEKSAQGESFTTKAFLSLLTHCIETENFEMETRKIAMALNAAIVVDYMGVEKLLETVIDRNINLDTFQILIRGFIRKTKALSRGESDQWPIQKRLFDLYKAEWVDAKLSVDVRIYLQQKGLIAT